MHHRFHINVLKLWVSLSWTGYAGCSGGTHTVLPSTTVLCCDRSAGLYSVLSKVWTADILERKIATHNNYCGVLHCCTVNKAVGKNLPDVIDPVLVQSKAALLVRAVDELLYVLSDVVRQLLEQHLRLVVCKRSHDNL